MAQESESQLAGALRAMNVEGEGEREEEETLGVSP